MFTNVEIANDNNIGSAIQYFRDTYHISQSELCKGLCSVSTLSRVEAGERDVDAFILEMLLERLGKSPYQFELILTDFDYDVYQRRIEINKSIESEEIDKSYAFIKEYDKIASDKGTPHKQFIMICKARINDLMAGDPEVTIDMLMEAISCTVPDFNSNDMAGYFLSYTELNIILDILQKMILLQMNEKANKIFDQIINYLFWHNQTEKVTSIYPKVAAIAGRFFYEQNDFDKALELCNKGLEMNKGSRRMEYLDELNLVKARATEMKIKAAGHWDTSDKKECISLYLKAYHIFSFLGDDIKAKSIKKHLQEEYQWLDID
jgi:transcriptional regulator with XRE-family HTH domain